MNKDLAEYEKDLNEMKEQILKEGNTLLTKKDLLERFCEIDKEYKGHPWNLLQILANINILIGEKPCENATDTNVGSKIQEDYCEDVIYKQAAIDALGEKPLDWTEDEYELGLQNQWKYDVDAIKALSPVTPQPKTEHWIPVSERMPDPQENGDKDYSDWLQVTIDIGRNGNSDTYVCEAYYCFSENKWYTKRFVVGIVTAWTSLPKAYKPQESEDKK